MLRALGYAGFGSDKLDDWRAFASKIDRLVQAAGKEAANEPL